MAFWLDRFRRPDEEDIWEELRQMLINSDKYEAEKKLQEARELEAFNKAWDKANGVDTELTSQKEAIKRNPYDEINSRSDWSEELKAQKRAEIAKIQEIVRQREREINIENTKEHAKNFGGAALEIGSAFVPGMLGSKVATGAIKTTKPLIEQIVKKNITRGGVEGLASGAMSGLGQGMLEDENLLKSSVIGGLTGGTVGSALGKISGEVIAKTPQIKNLDELLDKRNDWGIAFTKQSGKPAEAIDKLLEQKQGFVPKATNKEGIGDIDFVYGKQDYNTGQGYGLEHIIDGRTRKNKINGVEYVKSLPETFNNGIVTKGDKLHPDRIYIEDPKNKISIEPTWNGKNRNWVLTAFKQNKADSKRLSSFVPGSDITPKEGSYSTSRLISANNIIPTTQPNLNPSQPFIQKPLSHNEWLEELKRRRKKLGWW